jgi:hypothetical protein
MHPEKIWIVLVLLVLILVLSNAIVFAVVRGWSRGDMPWLKKSGQSLQEFGQDKDARELSERMRALREQKKTKDQQS